MRHRSALFVGGFPLALIAIGYSVVLSITRQIQDVNVKLTNHQALTYFGGLLIILIGGIYGVYWYISTANELKQKHNGQLPNYIYLIIPFLNWWWLWRYAKLATKIIGNKISATNLFLLLLIFGPSGMGLLQYYYNLRFDELTKQPDVE